MNTVPILSPRDVVKAFQKFGWEVARQRGIRPRLKVVLSPSNLFRKSRLLDGAKYGQR